ncbi:hypothetical protein [Pseudomonas entomophila]|uniref:hypothetical protein n=1 Tax=Pseudomonas entomophila TaxID=312306 RepID=UPI001F00FF1E|nr:hypothetical protein [Pseudomonas entomophila]MCG8291478.1 hypothetical protein [Pseudomonas entomophila]
MQARIGVLFRSCTSDVEYCLKTGLRGFKQDINNNLFRPGRAVEGQKYQAEHLLEKVDPHIRRLGNPKELLDIRNSVMDGLKQLREQYSKDLKSEKKSEQRKKLDAKLAQDSFTVMKSLFEAVGKTHSQWKVEMATKQQSHANKPGQPFQPLEDVKPVLRGSVTITQPCTNKIERQPAADLNNLELRTRREAPFQKFETNGDIANTWV